jgi:uncharacterized protein (DUF433 family)
MSIGIASHVSLDPQGRPWIEEANTKVIEIVLDKVANDWGPEEIQEQHPYLTLGQIHAALSYYYDHREEMDAEIARQDEEAEQWSREQVDTPFRQRIRALKRAAQ